MPAKKSAPKAPSPSDAPATSEPDATEGGGEGTESVPMNRAERRARGKGTSTSQPTARGKVVGGHGPAHTQRMWSNRRSGG